MMAHQATKQPTFTFSDRVDPRDKERLGKQQLAVLNRLEQGPATNMDLVEITHRFGARIKELRDAGFCIDKERGDGGIWIYTLGSDR